MKYTVTFTIRWYGEEQPEDLCTETMVANDLQEVKDWAEIQIIKFTIRHSQDRAASYGYRIELAQLIAG